MSANGEWVVPASHDERGYAVFDVSNRYAKKRRPCPTPSNDPRNSRTKTPERATVVWHGKSLWCRHCFASQIAAAEAETAPGRAESSACFAEFARSAPSDPRR